MNYSIFILRLKNITTVLCLLYLMVPMQRSHARTDEGIIVVASKDSPISQLSREEVTELFLGKRKYFNDILITPIDITDNLLRERFYLAVSEMNNIRVKAYWSRIVFSGQGRPPAEVSIAEAFNRVKADVGTLTYLPGNQAIPDMKVIFSAP